MGFRPLYLLECGGPFDLRVAAARSERTGGVAGGLERGYEGLLAKDESSPYRGGRTLSWITVRQRAYRVVERGWELEGSR